MLSVVVVAAFLFESWTDSAVGGASAHGSGGPDPALAGAQTIVTADESSLSSTGPLPGTVVLSFDDGPDPVHTPAVLDILHREHVPATFFVIGRSVADHPEIVQRMWAEGHEVANHTFTHPQMVDEASWRQRLELALTDG